MTLDLQSRWNRIDELTKWTTLSRIRNSFLARAIIALSLSSLLIANLQVVAAYLALDLGSLRYIFLGSIIFLFGYVLFSVWAPIELAQPGEVYDHVKRMQDIGDKEFVKSRLGMSSKLLERSQRITFLAPPRALINALRKKVGELSTLESIDQAQKAGLFHADLSLRQHDHPLKRLFLAFVMLTGATLLLLPTLINVVRALIFTATPAN